MFTVKRAIRALESDSYKKQQSKVNSRLPPVESKDQALILMKNMPLNKLAFQVSKLDTDEALQKQRKPRPGVPVLEVSPQQQFLDDQYAVWFYEPVSIISYLYAALALVAVFAVVLFPLWPLALRRGVWYLSMGLLGVIAAFFGLAIVRLVLFVITYVVVKPGIWIFPNLFEDLGVLDSFVPFWAWHGEDAMKIHRLAKKTKKSKKQKARKLEKQKQQEAIAAGNAPAGAAAGSGGTPGAPGGPNGPALSPAVNAQLMRQFQIINEKIKAIAAERQRQGNPMTPQEAQQLGKALLLQYTTQLQASASNASSPGSASPMSASSSASSATPARSNANAGSPMSKSSSSSSTNSKARAITLEDVDDE